MRNNYSETLSQWSTAITCHLVLTLFKGSYHQRKMCDWRLLGQYYSSLMHESVNIWLRTLMREIGSRLCKETTFL